MNAPQLRSCNYFLPTIIHVQCTCIPFCVSAYLYTHTCTCITMYNVQVYTCMYMYVVPLGQSTPRYRAEKNHRSLQMQTAYDQQLPLQLYYEELSWPLTAPMLIFVDHTYTLHRVCVCGGGGGGGGMYTMYMYMLYVHILYVGGGGGCVAFGRVTMQAQKLLAHNHP